MDDLYQASVQFDPTRDTLLAARPLRHGLGDIQFGEPIPLQDFTVDQLRQFIRVRFATVVFGATKVPLVKVAVPEPPKPEAPKATQAEGFLCDFQGCTKPGPYKTKLNLGAHKRSHKA